MKFAVKLTLVLAALATVAYSASAEEFNATNNTNRDENGKIVRGPYLTNPWYDNWSIGIAGGIQTHKDNVTIPTLSPIFEVNIAKWFTPVIGTRLSIRGINGKDQFVKGYKYNHATLGNHSMWTDCYDEKANTLKFGRVSANIDVMWNAFNSIWGYQYDRVWTVSPYFSAGYMRLFDKRLTSPKCNNEWNAGFGLLNNFHVCPHFDITLDLRAIAYTGRYHEEVGGLMMNYSASLGLNYTFHKWYWDRSRPIEMARDAAIASAAGASAAAAAAQDRLAKADAENQKLKDEVASLKDQLDKVIKMNEAELAKRVMASDMVIFFNIDKTDLHEFERKQIANYVKKTLDADSEHVFYIIGSADEGTGNVKRNTYLSKERALVVKNYMMKSLGVPEDQIVIKGNIISNKNADGSFDRCVIFENTPDAE